MSIAVPTRILGAIAWFPLVGAAIALDPLTGLPLAAVGGAVAVAVFVLALRIRGAVRGWRAVVASIASVALIAVSATTWYSALDGQDGALILPCLTIASVGGIVISAWVAVSAKRVRAAQDSAPDIART